MDLLQNRDDLSRYAKRQASALASVMRKG